MFASLFIAGGLAWGIHGLDFSFLTQRSGFQIAESLIETGANAPIWRTLLAGLLNTLRVSLAGIMIAIPLGIALAVARGAKFRPLRWLAAAVIEPLRNTPVLLQLFLWYGIVTQAMPGPREAFEPLPGVFLCNRGLFLPWLGADGIEWPSLSGFNIDGGLSLSPELTVLWLGLSLFHACYLAEIFRAGFEAVPRGQHDAANALALRPFFTLRRILLPQALSFALPSVTVQTLSLVKNSSLAVAIGFPDFIAVLGTTVNQNGRALEGLILTIGVFLGFNALLGATIERGSRFFGIAATSDLVVERRGRTADGRPGYREALLFLVLTGVLTLPLYRFVRWAAWDATWSGPATGCNAGACWAVVTEKLHLLLFGLFPAAEAWRPLLSTCIVLATLVALGVDRLRHVRSGTVGLGLAIGCWFWLLGGGFGLVRVPTTAWGGLSLTIGLAIMAVGLASVFAVPLALARGANDRRASTPAFAFIEIFRSVPLVALLLSADLLIPTLLPVEWQIDKLWRALAAITLLATVSLAEVLRGALASVPKGQGEAARALGLSRYPIFVLVILPQAIRIGLPATVNVFVGTIKDTSLVLIVGILDVTGAAKAAVADPAWRMFAPEIYLFLAAVYFALCFPIARFARHIETRGASG